MIQKYLWLVVERVEPCQASIQIEPAFDEPSRAKPLTFELRGELFVNRTVDRLWFDIQFKGPRNPYNT